MAQSQDESLYMRGDGNITHEQFMKLAEKRFQKMDANADGVISLDERKAMREKMQQHRNKMPRRDATDKALEKTD